MTHIHTLPACVGDSVFWQEVEVGESQGEETGLGMRPGFLASAQRPF